MSSLTAYQNGQSDLELAPQDCTVLLAPFIGTSPVTNLEDTTNGGLLASTLAPFLSVGNFTKKDGVKLTNTPTINDIKSTGKGSPTRQLASEAVKSITYMPQELKAINVQNYWGVLNSQISAQSAKGGITVQIPELPANLLWRVVLLAWDNYGGQDVFLYWIANKASVGKRVDMGVMDSNVLEHGVELTFLNDNAVGVPVVFGVCGQGWQTINNLNDSGFETITTLAITPLTAAITAALGVNHTKQLVATDSGSNVRTSEAVWTSSDVTKATVSSTGLVTAVAVGTANITAKFAGVTSTAPCAVTVS